MLLIRQEQMAALAAANERMFERAMLEHLQGNWAEEIRGRTPAEVRRIVHTGVEAAAAYGFTETYDIALLIESMAALSLEFHEGAIRNQWVHLILSDSESPDWVKRDRLMEQARLRHPVASRLGTFLTPPVLRVLGGA